MDHCCGFICICALFFFFFDMQTEWKKKHEGNNVVQHMPGNVRYPLLSDGNLVSPKISMFSYYFQSYYFLNHNQNAAA